MRSSLLAIRATKLSDTGRGTRDSSGGAGREGGREGAPRVLACVLNVMRVEAGQAQLSALKILHRFTLDRKVHGHLLEHNSTEPLIECLELCSGQALIYALMCASCLGASSPPIRTHLVRCNMIGRLKSALFVPSPCVPNVYLMCT